MTAAPKFSDLPALAHAGDDVSEIVPALGRVLRRQRKELRMTLADVAAKTGLSVGHLGQVENGNCSPSVETVSRLCRALRMSFSELFLAAELQLEAAVWYTPGETIDPASGTGSFIAGIGNPPYEI